MEFSLLISAVTLGFLGSFHCAGMCGPIALMLPGRSASKFAFLAGRASYHAGRIFTYGMLGAVSGSVGMAAMMEGWQTQVSLIAAAVIICSLVFPYLKTRISILNGINRIWMKITAPFVKQLMSSHTFPAMFGIGIVNGFLPCGLVYIALPAAATTLSGVDGALYMLVFGLGTLPMMIILSTAPYFLKFKYRSLYQRYLPLPGLVLAALLVLRCTTDHSQCISASPQPVQEIMCSGNGLDH